MTHRFLSEPPTAEVRREIEDSKMFLEDLLGAPVRFLSLPGGRHDGRTEAIPREWGYEAVCTSIPGATDPVRPGYLLRRLRIGRRTGLADFQRLVALAPWQLAREHGRYWSLTATGRDHAPGRDSELVSDSPGPWREPRFPGRHAPERAPDSWRVPPPGPA